MPSTGTGEGDGASSIGIVIEGIALGTLSSSLLLGAMDDPNKGSNEGEKDGEEVKKVVFVDGVAVAVETVGLVDSVMDGAKVAETGRTVG